jgi:cytoskeletal protein RodZ
LELAGSRRLEKEERRLASIGIGTVLKGERLRQNRDLNEISRTTRIAPRFIEAIEDEDFSRLPAIVFTRGFVKQYSAALNLDPGPLLAALPKPDIESAPLPDPPPKPGRDKWDPRTRSALQTVLFLAAAIVAGTFAWARFNPHAESAFSLDSWFVKEARAGSRAASKAEPVAAPPEASRLAVAAPDPAPIPAAVAAAVAKPEVSASPLPGIPPVDVVVEVRQTSWLRITADGKAAFAGTLQPNEVRRFGANGQVQVLAGNAGGVDITVNGKKLDPLGPLGQVRSVTLTSDGPLAAAQIPPPSPDQF